jgi:DNA-binding PucR family transcriptional regulator
VGGICEAAREFPRSYHEAQLALRVGEAVGGARPVTLFETLGVYQLLAELPDNHAVGRFVRRWIGALLDYDALKGAQLTATLSAYSACGGRYDDTAKMLFVHRSTVKYRLQRIRTVSGHDLGHPETRFNLQLAARAWQTLRVVGAGAG